MLRKIRHLIYKFFKSTSTTRWHFLIVAFLVPLIALSLKLFRYRRTHLGLAWLLKRLGKEKREHGGVEILSHPVVLALRRVKRHGPYRGHCLSRSLVLWVLLRHQGIAAKLIIGQYFKSSVFKAHAWVEYQGAPLNAGKKVRQYYTAFETDSPPRSLRPTSF